ncbi:MAG: long-chain fatty acid--CoA ligase [Solirubrobacterales bacterium]
MDGLTMDDYQLTLDRVVDRAARFYPDREIVSRRPDRSLHRTTHGAVAEEAGRLTGGLGDRGIGSGDRVATLLWNQPEHLAVYFGVPAMGAVVHTLNPRLHPAELSYIVNHAEDRAVIVDETLVGVLEPVLEARDFEQVIVVSHSGEVPAGTTSYDELIGDAQASPWPSLDECQAAAMCYTSGTTGRPKGVTYSHRSAVLHCLGAALPDALGISAGDTILPVVPMFHANAWGLPYAAAFTGARLVLPGPHLDAESILDLLEGERVTMTAGVPTVWMAILAALDAEPGRWDLSSLRRMVVGGAAVPQSMIEGFERHGLEVLQAWGMTETSPLGTVCHASPALGSGSPEQYAYRARQGVAVPLVEIRARNEGGEVPWDDETMGELEVRGPWVASGYHGGEGTEKFTEDGWFATGDVVTIDPGGCIKICDRAKDLVKSGGEWISSVDMENLLMAHPAVAEAAVIAVPDERWGERPLAVVALAEGCTASDDQLREHLSADFAKWQLPERFEYVEEIPRTATGKWKKTELRSRISG